MTFTPIAQSLHRSGTWSGEALSCELDYTARFIRRKRLTTLCSQAFLVDLPQTTSLDHGDALVLSDGRKVQITAAVEALMHVAGRDLVRLASHIGNRHAPTQIIPDHMLQHLGASVTKIIAPFTPEGGPYGHDRTHAHDHVKTAHDH